MMRTDYSTLALRQDGAVLHILFNRPEARNAMSLAMVDELLAALADAETDSSVRVVTLRGAGGHFCAGADLKDMAAARASAPPDQLESAIANINRRFGELCAAFARSPLPIVALAEGAVMGGGFGLVCAVDVAFAAPNAVFRLSETSLGLVPAQIAPYLVERLGYSQARRLAVTGGKIDAATALRLGLVHDTGEDVDALLTATLAEILACAPQATAATKALVRRARLAETGTLIDDAATVFARSALGAEGMEGTMAFLQKRKPSWAVS